MEQHQRGSQCRSIQQVETGRLYAGGESYQQWQIFQESYHHQHQGMRPLVCITRGISPLYPDHSKRHPVCYLYIRAPPQGRPGRDQDAVPHQCHPRYPLAADIDHGTAQQAENKINRCRKQTGYRYHRPQCPAPPASGKPDT